MKPLTEEALRHRRWLPSQTQLEMCPQKRRKRLVKKLEETLWPRIPREGPLGVGT